MLVVWQVKVPVKKRPLPINYKKYTGKSKNEKIRSESSKTGLNI